MTTNTEALLRGASRENDAHDEAKADRYCDMGVGCGEYGACYAAVNGEPERCSRATLPAPTQPDHFPDAGKMVAQPEQANGGEAVAGELDPLRAYEFGQLITKYSESFNGQNWDSVCDSVDRKNLAVALDHLTEAGAMLMNISERLLRTHPTPAASAEREARVIEQNARKAAQEQLYAERDRHTAEVKRLQAEIGRLKAPAASVSDEQIAACVKRASTYGHPFVGLLNPGGTPSDFSKRFTAEILALRPDQETPEQKDQSAWCEYVAGMVFGWLQMQRELPNEELCIKAIAGIIERRMWVLRPAQAGVQDDSALIDWLCQQVVEVRIPLRYGSQQCFIGSPDDNDGESVPWDIRASIRRAMLAAASKEGAKK
jgi:hypothetical protein